jgi:hypothetical protein
MPSPSARGNHGCSFLATTVLTFVWTVPGGMLPSSLHRRA